MKISKQVKSYIVDVHSQVNSNKKNNNNHRNNNDTPKGQTIDKRPYHMFLECIVKNVIFSLLTILEKNV